MTEARDRYKLEQFHQQQRALQYVNLLSASLMTADADYRRILNDFEALGSAIDCIKAAGERIEATYPKRGRIQAPERITEEVRQISAIPLKVVAEDTVIPIRRI